MIHAKCGSLSHDKWEVELHVTNGKTKGYREVVLVYCLAYGFVKWPVHQVVFFVFGEATHNEVHRYDRTLLPASVDGSSYQHGREPPQYPQ